MRRWSWVFLLCLLQCVVALPATSAVQEIPALTSPVMDMTGALTASQQQQLSQKLQSLHAQYGAQMQVLIVASSAPEDAFTYSMRAVEKWKLGTAKADDGLLLFVAKDDRRAQLQVGYGLEGTIPDVVASRLLETAMAPYFKQGDYYGGINAVVDEVYRRIAGETPAGRADQPNQGGNENQQGITFLIMLALGIVFIKIMKAVTGNIIAPVAGVPLVFAFIWLVIGWTLMMAFGVAVLALMLAWLPNDIWFALLASGRRGGSVGGGGGGSWSGGGGGFGGGGASGRW